MRSHPRWFRSYPVRCAPTQGRTGLPVGVPVGLWACLWACVGAGCWLTEPVGAADGAEGSAATAVAVAAFDRVVQPFLVEHCHACHSQRAKERGELKSGLRLDGLRAGSDAEAWVAVAEQLALGEMPPSPRPRPAAEAVQGVVELIRGELARIGRDLRELDARMAQPGYGNRVDHESLFSGRITAPASSPARLWRMSPFLYTGFVRTVSGQKQPSQAGIAQAFTLAPGAGFKDYAELFAIDEPTVAQLMRNAERMVDLQMRKGSGPRELAGLFDESKAVTPAVIDAAVRRQFQAALLRDPTAEEAERFRAYAEATLQAAGRSAGARAVLASVLLLPEALYRSELGAGPADEHGRRRLAPREIAYALAFALTDSPPDAVLLKAAQGGRLESAAGVAEQVRRLMAEERISKPRVMRFFDEYFEYPAAVDAFKDIKHGQWRPEVLVADTRRLIEHVLAQDRDVLRELLTTRRSFVNYAVDPQKKTPKAAHIANPPPRDAREEEKRKKNPKPRQIEVWDHYGLPEDWGWTAEQPIELPAGRRAGVLTQPSWLAAFATNDHNHAIRRGRWIRERLLGGSVPDLPITVDAQLPEAPDQSLRRRMEVTRDAYCWRCHERMNPPGLAFEMFDYLGRDRSTEPVLDPVATRAHVDKKGQPLGPVMREAPLDSSGRIDGTGDPNIDGEYPDAVAMIHRLADSPRVRQVFVRHAFRYWLGRNETLADAPTLLAADRAYTASKGSMRELIVSLLTSDSFLYRKAPAPGSSAKAPASSP